VFDSDVVFFGSFEPARRSPHDVTPLFVSERTIVDGPTDHANWVKSTHQ
jgi:hypothetical protein